MPFAVLSEPRARIQIHWDRYGLSLLYMWEMVGSERRYIRRFENGYWGWCGQEYRVANCLQLGRITAFSVQSDLCSAIGTAWRAGWQPQCTTFNYMPARRKNRKLPKALWERYGMANWKSCARERSQTRERVRDPHASIKCERKQSSKVVSVVTRVHYTTL